MECTYCGSDLSNYDPVFLDATEAGERISVGEFCNYACLSAYVDEEGLTDGDCCEWTPEA